MFEGIILIIIFVVGGLAALLALFFFLIALIRHSRTMLKIGLAISIIPFSLFGLAYWYYDIHIPRLNKKYELEYVGTYYATEGTSLNDVNKRFELNLYSDNTFEISQNDYFNFSGKGTWKSGATEDGQFEFRNGTSILFRAAPLDFNKLEVNRNFEEGQKIVFYRK